jgi:molybdopterin molybdotransferase
VISGWRGIGPRKEDRVTVDAALAIIADKISRLGTEYIPINAGALGRVLARPAAAQEHAPRFDCSAMDGFALRAEDSNSATTDVPLSLKIGQPIPAGAVPGPLMPSSCAPISTGAKIPFGADAVIEKESVIVQGDRLVLTRPVAPGHNIRRTGEDIAHGEQLLARRTRITPEAIGAMLNCGIREVEVNRRPLITLMSTGSEIAGPDDALSEVNRLDSNAPMIEASCRMLGLPCRLLGTVPDDRNALEAAFRLIEANGSDMVVTTGGVSAGSYDHVRELLEEKGARIWFHGIAMRPGKPLLFATLADGRPWFGLPGNSISAALGFRIFVLAAVRRMLGLALEQGMPVDVDLKGRAGVTLFLRARRTATAIRGIDLELDQRSHVFNSLLQADSWVRVDQDALGEVSALLFEKVPASI